LFFLGLLREEGDDGLVGLAEGREDANDSVNDFVEVLAGFGVRLLFDRFGLGRGGGGGRRVVFFRRTTQVDGMK